MIESKTEELNKSSKSQSLPRLSDSNLAHTQNVNWNLESVADFVQTSSVKASFLKKILSSMFATAVRHNVRNISNLAALKPAEVYLDLGCDTGEHTMQWAAAAQAEQVLGIEIVDSRASFAKQRGIVVTSADLNELLPYAPDSIDLITANQVIEHLVDSDRFLEQIHRVLKPGGRAIISTENASSWSNIFALVMGWQPFSHTNFTKKSLGVGNPLAMFRGSNIELESWLHVKILSYQGLKEYFECFGFRVVASAGAGYFPLPSWLANVDKRHAHMITFLIEKSS